MAEAIVCPYCRMPFDGESPAKIYCTACGTPHHEDCYFENGGCTVFGCAKAPADDPKLQVSYSDLNAAMPQQPVVAVQQPVVAPLPQFPSPYSGPLGLNQPVAATQAVAPGSVAPAAAYAQPLAAGGRLPKKRTTYIVLGVFLGMFGAHNFYAGYTGRAIGQLCLSVLTVFYLAIVSWIWAIVEICVVDKDSTGIQFS
jgi:TM2 domain-containing membrane protein YozV